jgi:hypothetical protein
MRWVWLIILALAALWMSRRDGEETAQMKIASDVLSGSWHATAEFLLASKLAAMRIMISAPRGNGSRLMHLSATNDKGEVIADTYAILKVSSEASWRRWLPSGMRGDKLEKTWIRMPAAYEAEEKTNGLFPKKFDLLLNPRTAQLRIHAQKKIWAVADRDTAASQLLTEPA